MTLTKLSLLFLIWACTFATNPTEIKRIIMPIKQRKTGYKEIALNTFHQRVPTDYPETDRLPDTKGTRQEAFVQEFLKNLHSCRNSSNCYYFTVRALNELQRSKPLYAEDVFHKLTLSEKGKEVVTRLLNYAIPSFAILNNIDKSVLCLYSNLLAMADPKNLAREVLSHLHYLSFAPGSENKCRKDLRHGLKIAERKVYGFSLRKADIPYYRMNFKQLLNQPTVRFSEYESQIRKIIEQLSEEDAYKILSHPLLYYAVPPHITRLFTQVYYKKESYKKMIAPINLAVWFAEDRGAYYTFLPEHLRNTNTIYYERTSKLFNDYHYKMLIDWMEKHRARQTEKYKDETCPMNLIENHYNSLEYGTIANEDLVNLCKAQEYCDQENYFFNLVHVYSVKVKDAFAKMCPEKSSLNVEHFAAFKEAIANGTVPDRDVLNTVKFYPEFSTMLFDEDMDTEYLIAILGQGVSLKDLLEINKYTFFLHEEFPHLKKAIKKVYYPFDQESLSPEDFTLLNKFTHEKRLIASQFQG